MQINFYHCDKRLDSTAVPAGTTQYPIIAKTVRLKDNCDDINPSFELERDSTVQNPYYNYIDWNETSSLRRYYRITNRTYLSNNLMQIDCEIDVLATYRAFILDKTYFVTRSGVGLADNTITDTVYTTMHGKDVSDESFNPLDYDDGFFVVGAVQDTLVWGEYESFKRGAVAYYTALPGELAALLQFLQSPDKYKDTGGANPVSYADYNPLSHLVSCIYIPYNGSGTQHTTLMFHFAADGYDDVWFPWTHTEISGISSMGLLGISVGSKTLPNHPQATSYLRYLNFPPYSRYTLWAGPFGSFEIDRDICPNVSSATITMSISIDCATGMGYLTALNGSRCFLQTSAMVGIEILLAQQSSHSQADLIRMENMETNAIMDAVSGAVGAVAAGNPMALVGSITSAIKFKNEYALSAYMVSVPKVSMLSSNGSMAVISKSWIIQGEFTKLQAVAALTFGMPYMKTVKLSTLAGYTQCSGAHYDGMCSTRAEREAIDAFLNGGFYIE